MSGWQLAIEAPRAIQSNGWPFLAIRPVLHKKPPICSLILPESYFYLKFILRLSQQVETLNYLVGSPHILHLLTALTSKIDCQQESLLEQLRRNWSASRLRRLLVLQMWSNNVIRNIHHDSTILNNSITRNCNEKLDGVFMSVER